MASLEELERKIEQIENRNKRVEQDKTWETSWARRILLMIFTYLAIGFYLNAINLPNSWINAIVPAIAFYLSTLTLPFFRKLWEKYIHKLS